MTIIEATAHAFLFFLAGFETTSSAVTYCLLELALNPDVQEKLRQEIDEVAEKIGFTHDSIMEMEYLDMVFSGIIQLFSFNAFLFNISIQYTKFLNFRDGKKVSRSGFPQSLVQRRPSDSRVELRDTEGNARRHFHPGSAL